MTTLLKRVKTLPAGFVWGGATAAYQVEGATQIAGKGKTMWDDYLKKQGRFAPDPASDFYHLYPEDIELAKLYGLNAIRLSIAWTRIFSRGAGKPNQAGVAYYHRLFKCCLANGLTLYVSLHHFDSPQALFETGDWLNRNNIDKFVAYADFCFKEFSEVKNWFTINELISLAFSQYIQGNFPPNHRFDVTGAIQAQHNELLAHARVVNLFKSKGYSGRIGLIHVLQPIYPYPDNAANRHAAALEDAFMNRFLLDGTFKGGYTAETMALINEILTANHAKLTIEPGDMEILKQAATQNDYFGLNYYQPTFVAAYQGESTNVFNGTGEKGTSAFKFKGVAMHVKNPTVPITDWDWNIYPKGLYDVLKRVAAEYPNSHTIYITENGLGQKEQSAGVGQLLSDDKRIDFIDQHVAALLKARTEGVNVQGYFVWSLQDQFSWANGYNKRYGLFYVDFATQAREIKKSALWFKALGATLKPNV